MKAFPGTSADSWADSRWSKAGAESKVLGFWKGEGERKEGDKTQLFRAPSAPKLCLPLIYTLPARKVPILSSDTVIRDADDRTIFILKITGLLTLDSPWSSEPPQPSSAVTEKLSHCNYRLPALRLPGTVTGKICFAYVKKAGDL